MTNHILCNIAKSGKVNQYLCQSYRTSCCGCLSYLHHRNYPFSINNYLLEIQSHFLILQYLTKKPKCMLVMPDALLTNLATDCGGILSEIYT